VDSKEVYDMNRIAEACAELALYRVLIRIDGILEYYSEPALAAMDKELWKLLEGMQTSEILTKEAIRNGKD
jgi:hypothetical protein